jgi:hypothetical protein
LFGFTFFGPKQLLSRVRESLIIVSDKSSLDALGETDSIDVINQVNQRRISDKELLELYVASFPRLRISLSEA